MSRDTKPSEDRIRKMAEQIKNPPVLRGRRPEMTPLDLEGLEEVRRKYRGEERKEKDELNSQFRSLRRGARP